MAYVAISNNLTHEVRDNINRMENKESKTLGGFDNTIRGDLPVFDQPFWKQHLHLKTLIPQDWCEKLTSATLLVDFSAGDDKPSETHHLSCNFDPPVLLPPNGKTYNISFKMSAEIPEIAPLIERYKRVNEVEERWKKVHDQVGGFLRKCKSLNEALKLWPQIEMYIPKDYIDRANKKSERTKAGESNAAEMLKEMDTDQLTSAAVIARMSGN